MNNASPIHFSAVVSHARRIDDQSGKSFAKAVTEANNIADDLEEMGLKAERGGSYSMSFFGPAWSPKNLFEFLDRVAYSHNKDWKESMQELGIKALENIKTRARILLGIFSRNKDDGTLQAAEISDLDSPSIRLANPPEWQISGSLKDSDSKASSDLRLTLPGLGSMEEQNQTAYEYIEAGQGQGYNIGGWEIGSPLRTLEFKEDNDQGALVSLETGTRADNREKARKLLAYEEHNNNIPKFASGAEEYHKRNPNFNSGFLNSASA